jgi:AcrR family transcriptional regulator
MSRPRTATDGELLMAAARAVSRVGPARLTLADVAKEAGVVPATLMQRFGSKRGLLLALAKIGPDSFGSEFAKLRAAHPTPLAALGAVADCMAGMASSPQELANHLAFLHMDLTDPDFHRHALEHSRGFTAELRKLIEEAIAAKELMPCDSARIARLMGEVIHGSLVTWALYREGTAQEWLRQDMETLLKPYLGKGKRKQRKVKAPGRPALKDPAKPKKAP